MNNKQFISELSQRLGYTSQVTQKMMYQLIDAMGDVFQEGNTVTVQNFGTFEVKKKMERVMMNPTTGQRMLVPPKLALAFKPNPTLKDQIKKGGAE